MVIVEVRLSNYIVLSWRRILWWSIGSLVRGARLLKFDTRIVAIVVLVWWW